MKSLKIMPALCTLLLWACGNDASAGDSRRTAMEVDSETAADTNPGVEEWHGADALQPASVPIVIDFNADWCGPCRAFKPVFHAIAEKWTTRARFISVNVDNYPALAQRFGVQGIPQVSVLFPDGSVKSQVGYMNPDQFNAFVTGALQ